MTTPHDSTLDLTDPDRVAVHVDRHDNPLAAMDVHERMRLMIRVLCELVAYGEIDENGKPLKRPMPAHQRSRAHV